MEIDTVTVSQLTQAIKGLLEPTFAQVCVQGEVSNFKAQSSGHLYFSLKDPEAQISAVMFRGNTRGLAMHPKEGDHVLAFGELSVYAPRGNYQLIVRELRHLGLGELLLKLQQLKMVLQQRGWFDAVHKKRLPTFPRRIGVVTSPTGAAIQDILNVLGRRYAGFHLILNPVKVQGEGAAQEIAQAIEQFNQYGLADVLIVGRGGGSIEDLWAFNEEVVAAAIFASKIPIISAVGHESDTTLADLVADMRAPTPSAAAEIVIREKAQQLETLSLVQRRLAQTLTHLVAQNRHRLAGLCRHPLLAEPYALLGQRLQKVDDQKQGLDASLRQQIQQRRLLLASCQRQLLSLRPTAQLQQWRAALSRHERGIAAAMNQKLIQCKNSLRQTRQHLEAIDPKNLLSKGYSILFAENDGSVIVSARAVLPHQRVKALVSDGEISMTVDTGSQG